MGELFKISYKRGYRHYFYGSTEETLEKLKINFKSIIQKFRLLECIVPPFGALSSEEDNEGD